MFIAHVMKKKVNSHYNTQKKFIIIHKKIRVELMKNKLLNKYSEGISQNMATNGMFHKTSTT